jgi:hypothetical protein
MFAQIKGERVLNSFSIDRGSGFMRGWRASRIGSFADRGGAIA